MTRMASVVVGLLLLSPLAAQGQDNPWKDPRGLRGARAPRPRVPDVAGPIVFTEAELPVGTTINGLALSTLNGTPIGATTNFAYLVNGVGNPDCVVNFGPGTQIFVDPPGIEGGTPNAQLTMDFGLDVTRVRFGFAFSCFPPETPSMTATALDSGGGTVGSVTVAAIDTGAFLENELVLQPGPMFRSVRIDINGTPNCLRFLMDNLAYPPLVTPVELQGFSIE